MASDTPTTVRFLRKLARDAGDLSSVRGQALHKAAGQFVKLGEELLRCSVLVTESSLYMQRARLAVNHAPSSDTNGYYAEKSEILRKLEDPLLTEQVLVAAAQGIHLVLTEHQVRMHPEAPRPEPWERLDPAAQALLRLMARAAHGEPICEIPTED